MKSENTRRGNGYHLDRCDACNTVCFPADLSHLYRPSGFNPNKRSLLVEKNIEIKEIKDNLNLLTLGTSSIHRKHLKCKMLFLNNNANTEGKFLLSFIIFTG